MGPMGKPYLMDGIMALMISKRFLIIGKVQGVWYRATVQRHASQAGFDGFVRNLPDGRVEAGVTCEERQLSQFIELLRQGSELSQVKGIEMVDSSEVYRSGFEIR